MNPMSSYVTYKNRSCDGSPVQEPVRVTAGHFPGLLKCTPFPIRRGEPRGGSGNARGEAFIVDRTHVKQRRAIFHAGTIRNDNQHPVAVA